ncbi:MAG TPA: PilZ domain-containing protein [Tepidisphaeraceae bacterium]|nr:PilZ domain-containing protein [Tepidisphaeraceae bacterium]
MGSQRQSEFDDFSEILQGTAERRRAHRETVVAIARLTPSDAKTAREKKRSIKVLVCDLSLRGVSLRAMVGLNVGDVYDFSLVLGPLKARSRLRIGRARRRADGTYQAGCEFI